jgi:hypothetical protein
MSVEDLRQILNTYYTSIKDISGEDISGEDAFNSANDEKDEDEKKQLLLISMNKNFFDSVHGLINLYRGTPLSNKINETVKKYADSGQTKVIQEVKKVMNISELSPIVIKIDRRELNFSKSNGCDTMTQSILELDKARKAEKERKYDVASNLYMKSARLGNPHAASKLVNDYVRGTQLVKNTIVDDKHAIKILEYTNYTTHLPSVRLLQLLKLQEKMR